MYKTEGGNLAFYGSNTGYDALHIGFHTGQRISIGKDSTTNIELKSDVTASGNISSSGNYIGVSASFTGGVGVYNGQKLYLDAENSAPYGNDTYLTTDGLNNTIRFYGANTFIAELNNTGLEVTGHITASGNISASGAITALSSNIVTIEGGTF